MNTLHDLRATLDRHAADVDDDLATARVAAVAGRARVVRRRRATGVGAVAVLALVTAGALSALPGDRDVAPADAPGTMTSLGWSYRLADTAATDGDRLREDLAPSELPRLLSWATTGDDQEVVIRFNGETWSSEEADFGDFVLLPAGFGGAVSVTGGPGLTAATYELDESVTPPGVGEGTMTFREQVAGRELAGAAVGDPGQAELVVPVEAERGTLWLSHTCEGLPARGYQVRIGVVGQPGYISSGDGCTVDSGFDPGGSPNMGVPGRWGPGSALRVWVTLGGKAVADGELPDLRLGLAAYESADAAVVAAGHEFAQVIEHGGKVWEVTGTLAGDGAELPSFTVAEEGQHLVTSWVRASPQTPFAVSADGSTGGQAWISGIGGAGSGPIPVGPGQDVAFEIRGDEADVEQAALVIYRRVDAPAW